jgi:hypothetical protein
VYCCATPTGAAVCASLSPVVYLVVWSSFHAVVLVRHYVVVCIVLHQHSDAAYASVLDASVLVYAVVDDI